MKLAKKITKFARKSLTKIHDKPLAGPTERQKRLIEKLRASFNQLAPIEASGCENSEKEWQNNVRNLKQLVLNDDPREFLRWHLISSIMFVKYSNYIAPEFKYLRQRPDWNSRWSKAIEEVPCGHPLPYYNYPKSSANLIHHAYHWAKFEEKTGIDISKINTVFEFGGGYGSMCRLLYNLGFSGRYIIFDMPAFSLLQKFFLESIGLPVDDSDSHDKESAIFCVSETEQLKKALNASGQGRSVFIATWSISETPADVRRQILPLIDSFDAYLISYQKHFQKNLI